MRVHFVCPEPKGDEPWFPRWFERQGWQVERFSQNLPFAGAGDPMLDRGGAWLFAGHSFRSELEAQPLLSQFLAVKVLSLR